MSPKDHRYIKKMMSNVINKSFQNSQKVCRYKNKDIECAQCEYKSKYSYMEIIIGTYRTKRVPRGMSKFEWSTTFNYLN